MSSVEFILQMQNNYLSSPVPGLTKIQKSHAVISGGYCGWGMGGIWFLTKSCCPVKEVWQCTLRQCRIRCFSIAYSFWMPPTNPYKMLILPSVQSSLTALTAWQCKLWPNFHHSLTLLTCIWFLKSLSPCTAMNLTRALLLISSVYKRNYVCPLFKLR
jgi:hypothetical protein